MRSVKTYQPGRPPSLIGLRCALTVARHPRFLHADSEDFDQTGQAPRLIRVFAGCTGQFFGLLCCGSDVSLTMLMQQMVVRALQSVNVIIYLRDLASVSCHLQVTTIFFSTDF